MTYVALDGGQFMKIAGVEAARIDEDFSVQSLEGEVRGAAGDWLVQGPAGERWIIAAETFSQNYEPALALDAPADAGGIDLS